MNIEAKICRRSKQLSAVPILVFFLVACAPPRTGLYTPPQPEVSKTAIIQYALAGVSPGERVVGEGNLKIYLSTTNGSYVDFFGNVSTYENREYSATGAITFSALDMSLAFSLTQMSVYPNAVGVQSKPLGLKVLLHNKGARPITVDWNKVVLTDELGRALRVIHQGVKLADTASLMAPSIIPPGSVLDDFIYPSEGIRYSPGRYGGWYGAVFFETRRAQTEMKLYLPLTLGTEEKAYTFTFRAESLKE